VPFGFVALVMGGLFVTVFLLVFFMFLLILLMVLLVVLVTHFAPFSLFLAQVVGSCVGTMATLEIIGVARPFRG